MMITVLIVDDEPEWLNIYSKALSREAGLVIAGSAQTKEKAIEFAKRINPDIVIMDLNLSEAGFEGLSAITEILKHITGKIIVATSYFEETLIKEAFSRGAVEYILKKQVLRLPEIIKEVHADHSTHAVLAQAFFHQKKEFRFNLLSKAERELLRFKKEGLSHHEIQEKACKTMSTIKNQVTSILAKLKVPNCQEAVEIFKEFIDKP